MGRGEIEAVKFDFIFIKNRLHRIPPRRFALDSVVLEIALLENWTGFREGFFFLLFLSLSLSLCLDRVINCRGTGLFRLS